MPYVPEGPKQGHFSPFFGDGSRTVFRAQADKPVASSGPGPGLGPFDIGGGPGVALTALEYTSLRALAEEAAGRLPGPEASVLKIRGTELTQQIDELLVEAIGYYAAPYETPEDGRNEPPVSPDYADGIMAHHLYTRAATIYGGSNEIQKNIIAKMVLGM